MNSRHILLCIFSISMLTIASSICMDEFKKPFTIKNTSSTINQEIPSVEQFITLYQKNTPTWLSSLGYDATEKLYLNTLKKCMNSPATTTTENKIATALFELVRYLNLKKLQVANDSKLISIQKTVFLHITIQDHIRTLIEAEEKVIGYFEAMRYEHENKAQMQTNFHSEELTEIINKIQHFKTEIEIRKKRMSELDVFYLTLDEYNRNSIHMNQ